MKGDRERLHDLVVEQEQRGVGQPEAHESGDAIASHVTPRSSVSTPHEKDSDQAEANLDRMLETGEENPIS